jgi:hypothetical protein
MSILSDIKTTLASTSLPIETGIYTGNSLNYIVLTPLGERNDDIADDTDLTETEEADVNLYYVGNYIATKNSIKTLLKSAGFFISDSQYIEHDPETKQHHYCFTVEKKTIL